MDFLKERHKVLVLAPHMDDEVIGCGGSLIKHSEAGNSIDIIYFTNGSHFVSDMELRKQKTANRLSEAKRVCGELGMKYHMLDIDDRSLTYNETLLKNVVDLLIEISPDIVYVPHKKEGDREHRIVHKIFCEANWLASDVFFIEKGKKRECPKLVLEYEVWTPLTEIDLYEDITDYMDKKMDLISYYESQIMFTDYAEAARGLNVYRGTIGKGKKSYAEAFKIQRICLDE